MTEIGPDLLMEFLEHSSNEIKMFAAIIIAHLAENSINDLSENTDLGQVNFMKG